MKYTIIGGRGYIGQHLFSALKSKSNEVYLPEKGAYSDLDVELGVVFYCAGLTADYSKRVFDTVDAHVTLLSQILKFSKFDRLIYLSSTRLYDKNPNILAREKDDLLVNPFLLRDIYDISKILGENLCITAGQNKCVVARLSNVFGFDTASSGFLSLLLKECLKSRNIVIDSSPSYLRDYIYIDEVIRCLLSISESQENGIFNVASGVNISNLEIAEILGTCGWKVQFKKLPTETHSPIIDIEKINMLGLSPVHPELSIRNYLAGI